MPSFFAERTGDNSACLCGEDRRHALTVLRLGAGDTLVALIEGARFLCAMRADGTLDIKECLPDNEPRLKITLYQGLPKGDKMEYIVQKMTELGVVAIVPVVFSRCVAQWDRKSFDKKHERLKKIAREATLQCGRAMVPSVMPPLSFSAFIETIKKHEAAFVPWEGAREPGLRGVYNGQTDCALIIGPEGGLTQEEVMAMGARPVTLGRRILRTETAGLAAAACLYTLSGDMP